MVLISVAAIANQHTEEFRAGAPRTVTLGEMVSRVGYAIVMLGVCAIACIVPALRALRVQPLEALRAE